MNATQKSDNRKGLALSQQIIAKLNKVQSAKCKKRKVNNNYNNNNK